MLVHRIIRIVGYVQGVGFRRSAKSIADTLGICGFARNERDGSVYIEAEGEEEAMTSFLAWCRRGPPSARVDRVDIREGSVKGFRGFEAL